MPQVPSSAVTAIWADGIATVTVRGELNPVTCGQVREQIASMMGDGPQRLVLDLVHVSDRFAAECLALIAVARYLLPPGGVLDVRSANPTVRGILALQG
jgi:anti-anti-sigma regulatory factor